MWLENCTNSLGYAYILPSYFNPAIYRLHFNHCGINDLYNSCWDRLKLVSPVLSASIASPSERLDKSDKKCRQADVEIYLNKSGAIEFCFPFKGILPCTESAVFSSKWFPMPEPYYLPEKLLKQLGKGAPAFIPSGRYPIRKNQRGYIITFSSLPAVMI